MKGIRIGVKRLTDHTRQALITWSVPKEGLMGFEVVLGDRFP